MKTAYALLLTVNVSVGIAVIPPDASAQILAPAPVAPPVSAPAPTFDAPPDSDFTPSLGRIFADTLTDFRRLPSLDSAVILSIGGVAAAASHPHDTRLSRSFSNADSMRGTFSAGKTIGAMPTQLAGAFATYSIGRMTGNAKVAVIGADLARAQFVSQGMTMAIKAAAGRTRSLRRVRKRASIAHGGSTGSSRSIPIHRPGRFQSIPCNRRGPGRGSFEPGSSRSAARRTAARRRTGVRLRRRLQARGFGTGATSE